jgi:hypothetical protein
MKLFLIIGLAMAALCACHRGAQNTISPSSPIGAPRNEASDGIEKENIMQLERAIGEMRWPSATWWRWTAFLVTITA